MAQPTLAMLAPLESPLPPPPAGEVFTPEQWTTLLSILDTFIPSITNSQSERDSKLYVGGSEYAESTSSIQQFLSSSADQSTISAYLSESATSIADLRPSVHRCFAHYVPPDQIKGLRFVLSSLDTRAGCLLLTGSTTSFHLQSPSAREQILLGWSTSYLPTTRALFRSFCLLAKRTWLAFSPTLPEIVGFPAVPKHGKRGEDYPYDFLEFSSTDSPSTIRTDVVIVGSGCGAGVCAKNLAEAGYSVLVVEKGHYFPSTHYPMQRSDGGIHLMENGGAVVSDDGSTAVLAGSCFGGGGTVNWSASLQPQHYVRQEWADQGLPFFTSAEFQRCLDKICGDMGVSTKGVKHNFANRTLLEGSRRLGYEAKEVPQNTGGKEHYCGYCTAGCAGATKNGPAVCFFPAAAKAGAKFIEGFDVRKIEFEHVDGKKKAVGVVGMWTERNTDQKREIRVKANKVMVCAGTLNSPLLLLRSGLTNPNIGKNLHLHPATLLGARFDEVTNPWEGSILTAVTTSLENLNNDGHGCKIECQTMIPTYFLPFLPWQFPSPNPSSSPSSSTSPALSFKTRCAHFHHFTGFVIIARDRDAGSIYPDPIDSRIRLRYTTSRFDGNNLTEGVIAAAKIAYVMGAREVFSMHPDMPPFVRPESPSSAVVAGKEDADADADGGEGSVAYDDGINDPAFQTWLTRLRRLGLSTPDPCIVGSAHQMGTCRMSETPRTGVVDPNGRVWGVDQGLYVADASVFPSASGVNPMVTNMGIAEWVSRGVVGVLRSEGGGRELRGMGESRG